MSVAKPCSASSSRSPWCSHRCVFKAGCASAGNFPTVWCEYYGGPLYGCPGHLCATNTAGYLNLATAAGAMAIHGHGSTAIVTVTRGVGDVRAHCH